MIGIIAATSSNGVIGVKEGLPFNYPEDLKHFKNTTLNSTVIMGRRTYASLGYKPLPNRQNIVMTTSIVADETLESLKGKIEFAYSIEEAIKLAKHDIWFIGGESVYREAMNYADRIMLTITPDIIKDNEVVHFPWINPNIYNLDNMESLGKLDIATYNRI